MNAGDRIKHRPSNTEHLVACSHPETGWLYTSGYPEKRFYIESCELIEAASEAVRKENIKAMAQSTGTGHRPACARRMLESA